MLSEFHRRGSVKIRSFSFGLPLFDAGSRIVALDAEIAGPDALICKEVGTGRSRPDRGSEENVPGAAEPRPDVIPHDLGGDGQIRERPPGGLAPDLDITPVRIAIVGPPDDRNVSLRGRARAAGAAQRARKVNLSLSVVGDPAIAPKNIGAEVRHPEMLIASLNRHPRRQLDAGTVDENAVRLPADRRIIAGVEQSRARQPAAGAVTGRAMTIANAGADAVAWTQRRQLVLSSPCQEETDPVARMTALRRARLRTSEQSKGAARGAVTGVIGRIDIVGPGRECQKAPGLIDVQGKV